MSIAIVATLDTKGEEIGFLKKRITEKGADTLVIDCGVVGEPAFKPDVPSSEIAELGGGNLEQLRTRKDRGETMEIMGKGAGVKLQKLFQEGEIDGIVGAGGSGNTSIATTAMRKLPVGVPKLMVSTMASGDVSNYVDIKDITMMYSVGDIEGLNQLTKTILTNVAGAIVGMARVERPQIEERTTVGITMFGVTTPAVKKIRARLENKGMEVLVFHATGTGGRAMESLVEQGMIDAVIDLTTTEIADEIVGGVLSAGPDRLEIGIRRSIPQVLAPGALDMVNFGPEDTVPEKWRDQGRKFHIHNPQVTLMRTTPEENREFAKFIAQKLSSGRPDRVDVLIPLNGVSMIDKKGEDFYDPEADQAFRESLKENLSPNIPIKEIKAHINDDQFAEAVVEEFLKNLESAGVKLKNKI